MEITKEIFSKNYYSENGVVPYFLIAARNFTVAKSFLSDLRHALRHYSIPTRLKRHTGHRLITDQRDLSGIAGHAHFIQIDSSPETYKLLGREHNYNLEQKRYFDKSKFYKALINQALEDRGIEREPYELELY